MKQKIANLKKEIFTSEYDIQTHLIDRFDNYYHTHSFFEVFYIINGEIDHYLNGCVSTLKTGDILFLRPQDLHYFIRTQDNKTQHRDIMITEKQWQKACDYLHPDLYKSLLNAHTPYSCNISIEQMQLFENALNSIVNNVKDTMFTKIKMNRLCIDLLSLYSDRTSLKAANYPALLNQIIAKMHKPDNFKLGIPKILSLFPSYSQNYLCRLFKLHIGMTMTDYINSVRLNYAILLLQTHNLSIQQIANECGFNNISYFNRLFKQQNGITPSQFKKKSN